MSMQSVRMLIDFSWVLGVHNSWAKKQDPSKWGSLDPAKMLDVVLNDLDPSILDGLHNNIEVFWSYDNPQDRMLTNTERGRAHADSDMATFLKETPVVFRGREFKFKLSLGRRTRTVDPVHIPEDSIPSDAPPKWRQWISETEWKIPFVHEKMVDSQIIVRLTRFASDIEVDHVIFLGGDGDLEPGLEEVLTAGRTVTVLSDPNSFGFKNMMEWHDALRVQFISNWADCTTWKEKQFVPLMPPKRQSPVDVKKNNQREEFRRIARMILKDHLTDAQKLEISTLGPRDKIPGDADKVVLFRCMESLNQGMLSDPDKFLIRDMIKEESRRAS